MNRFQHRGSTAGAVIAAVLAVTVGIAASIALAQRGGASADSPAISIRFPVPDRWYDNLTWFSGCRHGVGLASARCVPFHCQSYLCRAGRGIRGGASDPRGIAAVLVSVRRDRDGRYRDHGTFSSASVHYVRATLSGHGTTVQWFRWLGLPQRGGRYTVQARLIPRGGNAADPAETTTLTFAADHTPPPAPRLVVQPTGGHSIRLLFSDRHPHVTFRCQVDADAWRRCRSPQSYTQLSYGRHVFSVRAVDHYGRDGPVTRRDQPAQTGGGARLTITGGPAAQLYPDAVPQPILLRLTNPNSDPIIVTRLSVEIQPSSLPAGCDPAAFVITSSSISAADPIRLGSRGSVTLSSGGFAAPTIRMLDTRTNQDACAGASLALTFAGQAHTGF